jgi:hypothetical protein
MHNTKVLSLVSNCIHNMYNFGPLPSSSLVPKYLLLLLLSFIINVKSRKSTYILHIMYVGRRETLIL